MLFCFTASSPPGNETPPFLHCLVLFPNWLVEVRGCKQIHGTRIAGHVQKIGSGGDYIRFSLNKLDIACDEKGETLGQRGYIIQTRSWGKLQENGLDLCGKKLNCSNTILSLSEHSGKTLLSARKRAD